MSMTSYTTKSIPEGLWDHWKEPIPRSVSSVGERNIRLLAADVACRQLNGRGIIEEALAQGLITENAIEDAYGLDPID